MAKAIKDPEIAAFLHSFSEGLVLTDSSCRFAWINSMAEYLLGISAADWIQKPASALTEERPELEWIFEEEQSRPAFCWEMMRCEDQDCPLHGRAITDCWSRRKFELSTTEAKSASKHSNLHHRCLHCRVYNAHFALREKEVPRKDTQDPIVLQVQSAPLCDTGGTVIGKIRLLRDVTHDKQLGKLKDEFLDAFVHELRSPLTSIRSYAEILLRYTDTDPGTQREFLGIIHTESERLDQMIEDLMDLQELDPAKSVWRNREVHIPDLIQRVLQDYHNTLEKKKITPRVEVEPQASRIWTDPEKIYHVIFTLLRSLASKTPRNGTLLIKTTPMPGLRKTDTSPLIRFSVTSQPPVPNPEGGPSDPAQAQSATQRKRGLGLGVTLCRTILNQYGGNLWMEEGEGSQTTYSFTMPTSVQVADALPEAEQREIKPAPETQPAAAIDKGKKRLLIVDDEPNVLNPITIILQKEGYDVHPTTNARRALKMVKEVKPDLIISDVKMPDLDGYAFFQQIQEDESTKTIPFIFITGQKEKQDRIRGFKTGVDDYLAKPVDPEILIARVEALLRRVERYKDLSRFDSLTGALTRKAFEEHLNWEILRANLEKTGFCLVMVDLDHFKEVNDTHGHPVGDFVLRSLVAFFQGNLREEDIIARYGGEEFCIVMPSVDRQTAKEILERIRKQLSDTSFCYEKENLPITITCSFGVCAFPMDGATAGRLIEKSDAALYQAKRSGRNRVVLFE